MQVANGPTIFSRFAYPPNEQGLCGPDDHELLAAVAAGADDPEIHRVVKAFTGAYPYLDLIARQTTIGDALDPRVVEAYWLGLDGSHSVDLHELGNHLRDRFYGTMGSGWSLFTETLEHQPLPTHAFHVFAVYPWLGKLRDGMATPSLGILDRCRIRWGTVLGVDGLTASVASRPLRWTDRRLWLDEPETETVRLYAGLGVVAGDTVALHWDWACAVLDTRRARSLETDTRRVLTAVNAAAVPIAD